MMSLRESNPISRALGESICRFSFELQDNSSLTEDVWRTLVGHKGLVNHGMDGTELYFDILHSAIDAFGGMRAATEIFELLNKPRLSRATTKWGRLGDYSFCQLTQENHQTIGQSKMSSQTFLQASLSVFRRHGVDTVAFPIRLDPLENLSTGAMWGNSFVIIELDLSTLSDLLALSKPEWVLALRRRAERTLRINERRPMRSLESPILISLIGDISRFSWCSFDFNPQTFRMIPTPNGDRSTNLVLWSSGKIHGFVACHHTSKNNPWIKELEDIWRGLLS